MAEISREPRTVPGSVQALASSEADDQQRRGGRRCGSRGRPPGRSRGTGRADAGRVPSADVSGGGRACGAARSASRGGRARRRSGSSAAAGRPGRRCAAARRAGPCRRVGAGDVDGHARERDADRVEDRLERLLHQGAEAVAQVERPGDGVVGVDEAVDLVGPALDQVGDAVEVRSMLSVRRRTISTSVRRRTACSETRSSPSPDSPARPVMSVLDLAPLLGEHLGHDGEVVEHLSPAGSLG